jgi:hypothetical protein
VGWPVEPVLCSLYTLIRNRCLVNQATFRLGRHTSSEGCHAHQQSAAEPLRRCLQAQSLVCKSRMVTS